MESLYLLLPLSVLLVLALIGLFAWALEGGQFEDLEREGRRALDLEQPERESTGFDFGQPGSPPGFRQ